MNSLENDNEEEGSLNSLNESFSIDDSNECSNTVTVDVLEKFLRSKDTAPSLNDSFSSQSSTVFTKIETLLKSYYIDQKRINHKTNILQFWKSMQPFHPELYRLAFVVFSVPATQVSVERLFSGLKFILSPYRSNIGSKNLEDQLLIRTNKLFDKKEKLLIL